MAVSLKLFLIALLVMLAPMLPTSSRAQDSSLQSLDTWGLSRGWEGVGLLNIAGRATCTGVMIRPDLVLTAAHCMIDLDTGQRTPPHLIEFRAGWRDGKAIARRFGKYAIIHPGFESGNRLSGDKVRADIALLQLAAPILTSHANPFQADKGAKTGNQVSVVSYGAGRNDAPSRQRSCIILDDKDGLIVMSCDVVPGSSGSPVFAIRNGRPRIVSVVSALGHSNGRQVSYGMDIQAPLENLLADYRAGRGVYPKITSGSKRLMVGSGKMADGARFLKP